MGTGDDQERLNLMTGLCGYYVKDNKFSCAQLQIISRAKLFMAAIFCPSRRELKAIGSQALR